MLKLNETLGGIAVSVGFKSARISSEHLVCVSNEGLCTVRVLFFFAAYSSEVIGYIAVETVFPHAGHFDQLLLPGTRWDVLLQPGHVCCGLVGLFWFWW